MQKEYKSISGQSLQDVCLNTYGTLDLIYKLIVDSGIENLEFTPTTGTIFVYDDSLVTGIRKLITKKKYATYSTVSLSDFVDDFNNDFN